MKYLTLFMLIMSVSVSYANKRITLEEFCKSNQCRKDLTIKLKKRDGNRFDRIYKLLPPAVQENLILIYAGETLYIEADEGKEGPIHFSQVKEIKNRDKTLVFSFKQQKAVSDGKSMWLTVENPFSKAIRYKLKMMPLNENRFFKTSSCPVMATKSSIEMWPFPIFSVVITDIHFQLKDDDGVCKE